MVTALKLVAGVLTVGILTMVAAEAPAAEESRLKEEEVKTEEQRVTAVEAEKMRLKEEEAKAEEERVAAEAAAAEGSRLNEEEAKAEEEQVAAAEAEKTQQKEAETNAEEERIAVEVAAAERIIFEEEKEVAKAEEERVAADEAEKMQQKEAETKAEEERVATETAAEERSRLKEEEAKAAEEERVAADEAEKMRLKEEGAKDEEVRVVAKALAFREIKPEILAVHTLQCSNTSGSHDVSVTDERAKDDLSDSVSKEVEAANEEISKLRVALQDKEAAEAKVFVVVVLILVFVVVVILKASLPLLRSHFGNSQENEVPDGVQHSRYDAIASLTSLSDFAKKRMFAIWLSSCTDFNINDPFDLRIIAVVGLFDKGKTFLVNKLFGKNLPSTKLHSTQGLSMIYVADRKMLVIDTAGIQSTVSFRTENVDPIVDAQTTEAFVFELISRICDMLIFVVNDFTWVEQRYVAMFHEKDKLQQRNRELIVVHNLRTTESEEEATLLFEKQIVSCYPGATSHLSALVFSADQDPATHHVTFCKDGSIAGLKYNAANCNYVMSKLEYGVGGRKPVVISELLATHITELLPKFLLIEKAYSEWNIQYQPSDNEECLHCEFLDDKTKTEFEGYSFAGILRANNSKLTMKTTGVIGEFGEVVAFDVSFKPEVNIFEKKDGQQLKRTIQIECPGVTEDQVEIEEVDAGISVTIDKKKSIQEASILPVKPIIERHGKFEEKFPIPDRGFELKPEETSLEYGVLKIILRKDLNLKKKITLVKSEHQPHALAKAETVVSQVPPDMLSQSMPQHKSISEHTQSESSPQPPQYLTKASTTFAATAIPEQFSIAGTDLQTNRPHCGKYPLDMVQSPAPAASLILGTQQALNDSKVVGQVNDVFQGAISSENGDCDRISQEDCLFEGTSILTPEGVVLVESLSAGSTVLSLDVKSGNGSSPP